MTDHSSEESAKTAIALLNCQECKSIEDFHYGQIEVFKGQTPEDIKDKCLKLCQLYIGADWLPQTVDSIDVKRLSGGLTNQLYHCSIAQPRVDSDVPQEVAILLYGKKHFNADDQNERLSDVIISLMVSANHLGPKIYGVFDDGYIQHFHKHRQFRLEEQMNPVLAEKLFRTLARVHSMDVPIKKTTNWVFKYFDDYYHKSRDKLPDLIKIFNCPTLAKHPVKHELDWLKKIILDINSQMCFTHIDFRGSNVMVTQPDDQIILCDFEYSSYGYRGFDFGTIFIEWNQELSDLFRWDAECLKKFADDNQLKSLLNIYVNEMEIIHGKEYSDDPNNSMDQLVKETKLFSLVALMFIVMFSIRNNGPNDTNDFPLDKNVMMGVSDICYQGYLYLKQEFIKQNTFN